jgi:hypothetical protein
MIIYKQIIVSEVEIIKMDEESKKSDSSSSYSTTSRQQKVNAILLDSSKS